MGKSAAVLALSFFLGFFVALGPMAAGDRCEALAISGLRTDRTVLTPGGRVSYFFQLDEAARISASIVDPDYAVVKKLADYEQKPAGIITFTWDGTDTDGNVVPNEAYDIVVEAVGTSGRKVTVDNRGTGGDKLDVPVEEISSVDGAYLIRYTLSGNARVAVRAGIHQGPLLRTIVDWQPQRAGLQEVRWDGKDDTGVFDVLARPKSVVYVIAYLLPKTAVLMTGSTADYRSRKEAAVSSDQHPATLSPSRQIASAANSQSSIAIEASLPSLRSTAPHFSVALAADSAKRYAQQTTAPELSGPVPLTVSGTVGLEITVAPDYLEIFNQSRFETVVYVDDQRFDEEENTFSPYIYRLDTSRLADGEHRMTINQVGIEGQVGSYSFLLKVANGKNTAVNQ